MYAIIAVQARFDWVLVSAFLSKVALANYSVANKLIEVSMLLAGIWARASFPWISRINADAPELRVRLALLRRLFVVVSMVSACIAGFCATPGLHLVIGDKYAGADLPTRIMAPLTGIFMLNQYFIYLILARNLEKSYTTILSVATILQIGVDLLLIHIYGIAGAAWGMVAMGICLHIGQMWILRRDPNYTPGEMSRQAVFTFGLTAILAVLVCLRVAPILGTLVGMTGVLVLGATLVMRPEDWAQIVCWMRTKKWQISTQ
jgi:O-antigen/teichoic acid export membrane protein